MRPVSPVAHIRQFAKVIDRLLQVGRFGPGDSSVAIASCEGFEHLEILMLLKPTSASEAQISVEHFERLAMMGDQPGRARRDKIFQGFEARSDMI